MNSYGSEQKILFDYKTFDIRGGNPLSWSHDCTKIAFYYSEEILVINADGIGLKYLTNNQVFDYYPTWSLDGKHFFIREECQVGDCIGYICVMNA